MVTPPVLLGRVESKLCYSYSRVPSPPFNLSEKITTTPSVYQDPPPVSIYEVTGCAARKGILFSHPQIILQINSPQSPPKGINFKEI